MLKTNNTDLNKNKPDYVGQVLFNYVQTIIKNNTYLGNLAKIKFATWRKINA